MGNFDFVFEEAYEKSYRPFVDVLEDHSSLSTVLHFSGCLIEWIEDHHPGFLDRVAKLVERGNTELLSGGFYEPILSVVPDHDKVGQIQKMNDYLTTRFDYTPTGIWLTERVWEPHLAKPIREAGIEYTTIDDFHFLASGKTLTDLTGYFTTEEQGHSLAVFPIHRKLRYAMPFEDPKDTIEYLRTFATEEGDRLIVMADDGEKFGLWPGTFERCYGQENWLEEFFTILEENQEWLKTTTFKEYHLNHPPSGRIYLPSTSYFEMNEWTLPARGGKEFSELLDQFRDQDSLERVRPFLRGGTWRNFLAIYDESNWMQKRTTEVSHRVASDRSLTDGKRKEAQDEVWKSQCNCAYWHGVFGGLYLPHLRHAVYEHLISAEKLLEDNSVIDFTPGDIDGDGAVEYRLRSETLNLIASERGGTIREFDYLPRNFNLLNTLRRHPESYHAKVKTARVGKSKSGTIHRSMPAKEPGLGSLLQYDPWPREMLIDHFVPAGTRAAAMKKNAPERGDFPTAIYSSEFDGTLSLTRDGKAFGRRVGIQKRLSLNESEVKIEISVANHDEKNLPGLYACELNFAMLGGHTPDRYYEINGKPAQRRFLDTTSGEFGVRSIGVVSEDDGFRALVFFTRPTSLLRFPVETVSMSEAGLERIYQSSVILPYWKLGLRPGESANPQFVIRLEPLE